MSDCILIIDRDGTRVGLIHGWKENKADAENAEQISRWKWRRATPGNAGSSLLSAAASSHRTIGFHDDNGRGGVSLLALGDGKLLAYGSH